MKEIEFKSRVGGRYKLTITRPDGSERTTGWFDNLITDAGLDMINNNPNHFIYTVHVGSGNATPVHTDTSLQAEIANTGNITNTIGGHNNTMPNPYTWSQFTFVFAQGAAAGNLSEVGVSGSGSSTLFSRALIVDGGGSPTTITVLSDEILTIVYELRRYPPTSDVTGTVTLNSVNYAWTLRASSVGGWATGPGRDAFTEPVSIDYAYSFSGSIGADIFSSPSGTNDRIDAVMDAYTNGSFTRTATLTFGPSVSNYSGGIGAITFLGGSSYSYQIGFSPNIAKDNTMTLTLRVSHTWAAM